ncbi:hypothetical protein [Moheibacter sp.]|uniref:hypothetical protein n=1 Tax=Moheibacter sp. TaxID=1965316 RepID=UPI003C73D022
MKIYIFTLFTIFSTLIYSQSFSTNPSIPFNTTTIDIKNLEITNNPTKLYHSNSTNDKNKIYFNFDIKGKYKSLELYLYYESVSESNRICFIQWDNDFEFPIEYPFWGNKEMWSIINSNFTNNRPIRIPGRKFVLVAKYQRVGYSQVTKVIEYTAPITDADGDGVIDDVDQCPYEPGSSSNFGCPFTGNLKIERVVIRQNGGSYPIVYDSSNESSIPTLGDVQYQVEVYAKNQGTEGKSYVSWQASYYKSTNCTYPNCPKIKFAAFNFYYMPPNGALSSSGHFGKILPYSTQPGYHEMAIEIDYLQAYDEENEVDNILKFPFFYQPGHTHKYSLEIYDSNTNLVESHIIKDEYQLNDIKRNLPKGIYIFKTENDSRKISIK